MKAADAEAIAAAVLAALDGGRQIESFTARHARFTTDDAYEVAAILRERRMARGERPVGRKIGFTNRNIWPEYGVYEPIWGDVYDTTSTAIEPGEEIAACRFPEPRIEPEIVLGLEAGLTTGMGVDEIAAAIGWVAHGFEIVQSIFPGWRFTAADCVANGGLHGLLCVGPRLAVPKRARRELGSILSKLRVVLSRDGVQVDTGVGANVLDGPVEALAHLVGHGRLDRSLRAGEIVTTGTLTRAFPVTRGERWSTSIEGGYLPGLSVRIG